MTPEELSMRKKQLRHADNEWRDAGLIPDGEGGSSEYYSMMRYLDAYRGDFPDVLRGGTEKADQMVGNIFFSLINTMTSQVSGRTPDPVVRPIGGSVSDPDSRRRAWINEQIVRSMMIEKKFKDEVDQVIQSAVMTPFGIVQHGFTPEVEYDDQTGKIIRRFKDQTTDMPWIQFRRPWQFRIDPMVTSFRPEQEPRWVAFQNLWYEHQIRKNENMIFRKDLKPTHMFDLRPREKRRGSTSGGVGEAELMPMYEEWLFYDFDERKVFGISHGSDKLIREEQDWPFDWGQLPYSFLEFNHQMDTPFGVPFPRLFYDEQIMYNKIWTILNALVSRSRTLLVYNKQAFDDDESNLINPDSLVEAIATTGDPNTVIKEFKLSQIDGQLIGLLYQLKEQIREVLGISSFDRGQRANVETAAEVNKIGAGADLARGRNQDKVEALWSNIIKVSHRAFLQSPEARQIIVPIVGQDNMDFLDASDKEKGFIATTIKQLQGEFSYGVRINSTLKIDPAQEFSLAVTGYNILGGVKGTLINQRHYHNIITEMSGQDPLQAVMSEQNVQKQTENQQPGEEGQGGGGGGGGAEAAAQQGLPEIGLVGGR